MGRYSQYWQDKEKVQRLINIFYGSIEICFLFSLKISQYKLYYKVGMDFKTIFIVKEI